MPAYHRRVCFACVALLALNVPAHAIVEVFFPADAVINVRDYGAIPDDGKDDTQAIQKAITENVGTGRTIYFPGGTYDLSNSLVAKNKDGHWEAHLTLQGQAREKTTLRLKNHADGFDRPDKPRAVIVTGSHWEPGDDESGGGNKAFRNNIRDLTIEIGKGNPGAIGIDWAVSNQGTISMVNVESEDGQGVAGVSMRRRIPGPGHIQALGVGGFGVGVDIGDLQYGVTIENSTLMKQSHASLRLTQNLAYARGLRIQTPIQVWDDKSMLLFIREPNRAPDTIDTRAGHVVITSHDKLLFASATNTPGMWWYPQEFQPVGPRLEGERDDTAAIQRAIDAGKPVVYFPIKRDYFLSDTVTIRGKVRHVLGMGVEISLGAAKEPFSNRDKPRPLFRIEQVDRDEVIIENCFFNAQYPGEVIFENNSPKTLVIKHCMGWVGADGRRRSYQNTPASFGGKVFIEDCFLPGWRFEKQDVWARQFNPENPDGDGVTPQVANVGGNLWILGFKTEGPAPFIHTSAGGKTELLGAYNYISATAAPKVPEGAVPYLVEDSTASLTFATDNFRADSDYKVYIRQIKNGKVVKDVTRDELPPRNGVKGDRSFVVTNWRTP